MSDKASIDSEGTGPRSDLLPVVGIGASAGGLAALKELFGYMPADTGLAFVVVVHLSPEHESHLADLLQPHTQMPVEQVTQTLAMEPNHIYVIPPGSNLTAVDTHLRLSDLEEQRRQRAPIDHFFRTLAEAHHETAIGVILTGTGSDGTLGLRMIREKSGLTIAQDPAEAEYDSMPQSAIASGVVDLVLPLTEMPDQIVRFATTDPSVPVPDEEEDVPQEERHLVLKILTQVRARTGHDFSRYKQATVMRRIRRRMQIHQIEDLERYAERLRRDREEAQRLLDDLLITVTNFFRDPETFEVLERDIIPKLFAGEGEKERVRVWSVGCATGEEAYSLAMLLLEQAAQMDRPPEIQVFATDLHAASLHGAREGLYPETIEADVSPERLRRFFVGENSHYRVRPELRDVVVFAPHNLMKDPPFSHIDLISCRNVLIYLQREVQQEIIPLFHYALRPSGHLVLGGSETIDRTELFERVDKPHCIYRRRNVVSHEPRLSVFPMKPARASSHQPGIPRHVEGAPSYGALHHRMVEQYAPPSILVNDEDAIVHTSTRAGKYLTVPGGEPSNNVFRLVREPLRIELRAGLFAARDRGEAFRSKPIPVEIEGEPVPVVVRVQPAGDDDEMARLFLVIFDEAPPPEQVAPRGDGTSDATVRELDEELAATRARLRAMIEEYESNKEEMRASNEELQSMNEELRSTMEELETSKEELQSINEELATVNQENRHKVEELAQLSSDLQNLLGATDIATLFLDRQLRIMRFTAPMAELFNVRHSDRGRPISDLTHRFVDASLQDDAREVLDSLVPVTRETHSEDGRWFLTRFLPYRSAEDRIDGVVITFIDITDRKRAEEALKEAKLYAEKIVETLHEPLLVLTPDLCVNSANPAFFVDFEVEPEATIGQMIYDLGNGQWDIPELRTLLEDVLPDSKIFNDYEVRHVFQDLGERVMLLNARRLDHVQLILLGIRDITEKKTAEEALRASEERYRTLFDSIDEGFCVIEMIFDQAGLPVDYRFIETNPAFDRHTGLKDPEGKTIREFAPEHEQHWFETYGRVAETGESERFEHPARALGGRWFDVFAFRIGGEDSRRVAILFKDVTEQKRTTQELEELNRTLEQRVQERTREVRHLASTLTMAEQEERRRIARILHDDLQQLLFGLHLRLEFLSQDMAGLQVEHLEKEFTAARDWVSEAIETTRQLSVDLSPPILKNEGLPEALRWLARQMLEKHQLKVDLKFDNGLGVPDEDLRTLLFQAVRELLFNVVKHAGVREAQVRLAREEGLVVIEVIDDGRGFDVAAASREAGGVVGIGLFSVHERLRLIGGELHIESNPGEGTRVSITTPATTDH